MINPDDIKAGMVLGQADAEILRDAIARLNKMEMCTLNAPDGWKLVPIEPTRQMMSQGHFALGGTDRGKFRRIYQAMIEAAPEVGK